jgi:hypothetical protein
MRLGELLVEMGSCGADRVQEALEGQVIFGGRLGTNLLEIGALTEDALARALSRQHDRPALHGDLHVDTMVAALLKPKHADRFEVVPYRLEGRRLSVLCCDPADLRKLDEVAFVLGKQIAPVIVPEARLWALLRALYGVERPTRGLALDSTRVRRGMSFAAERAPARPDLMGETEFEALYTNRSPQRPESVGSASASSPHPILPPILTGPSAGPVTRVSLVRRSPGAWAADPGDPFCGSLVSSEEVLASLQAEATAARESNGAPAPLSFAEAVAALSGVDDRGAVARVVLRYARSRFRRAVLLTVHARAADGWEGIGDGLTPHRVARLHVPLGKPSVVNTVVESRSHFLGPLARTEANIRLLRALAGGAPKNAFAMPILARGKVVNVLYADRGRGGVVSSDGVGELLILAARISQSYDVLLRRTP